MNNNYYRRPFVTDLRDWLICLVLLLASIILVTIVMVGYETLATPVTGPGPAVIPAVTDLVPDPGTRPSPMPWPPVAVTTGGDR